MTFTVLTQCSVNLATTRALWSCLRRQQQQNFLLREGTFVILLSLSLLGKFNEKKNKINIEKRGHGLNPVIDWRSSFVNQYSQPQKKNRWIPARQESIWLRREEKSQNSVSFHEADSFLRTWYSLNWAGNIPVSIMGQKRNRIPTNELIKQVIFSISGSLSDISASFFCAFFPLLIYQ
jgi:hypothetical protein